MAIEEALPTISFRPIGRVRSPHQAPAQTPIQPCFAEGCRGTVEIFEDYAEGLQDIEGFSHLILLYHLDRAEPAPLRVIPYMADHPKGVFATRYPSRPNPIGLSIVRLAGRCGNLLHIENIDILDGTPLLDIKPFYPRFDIPAQATGGWTDHVPPDVAQARGRRLENNR